MPLLATPPTVTVTESVVALGTEATMTLRSGPARGRRGGAVESTALVPCVAPKFAPLIVTAVPTLPDVGDRLVMFGADPATVNATPLLATPPTVT
jgi:hypothetical protein